MNKRRHSNRLDCCALLSTSTPEVERRTVPSATELAAALCFAARGCLATTPELELETAPRTRTALRPRLAATTDVDMSAVTAGSTSTSVMRSRQLRAPPRIVGAGSRRIGAARERAGRRSAPSEPSDELASYEAPSQNGRDSAPAKARKYPKATSPSSTDKLSGSRSGRRRAFSATLR